MHHPRSFKFHVIVALADVRILGIQWDLVGLQGARAEDTGIEFAHNSWCLIETRILLWSPRVLFVFLRFTGDGYFVRA